MEQIFITNRSKALLVFICLAVVIGVSFYIALPFLSVNHDMILEESLNNKLKEDNTTSLDLGEYIGYEWKRAYSFSPYTSESYMKDKLGFRFYDPVNMSIRDDIELFVVVKEDNTFEYANVELQYGYMVQKEDYLTPENSGVEITPN